MTYDVIKKILEAGNHNQVVTKSKLDIFLLNNRITSEQYSELIAILQGE